MGPVVALGVTSAASACLLVPGIIEKRHNERNIEKIPVRVNVNGIRGKSTATRLITAILNEAGYKTIGKTTGTAARMIYWDREEERAIVRKPHGVRISEQLEVIDEAARLGADALVCECMAVRPEYQRVYQEQMIKSTVTVIVNVLEDHLDEMGPTTREIAMAFAQTIPANGVAVIPDDEFTSYFTQVAQERGSRVIIIDDSEVDPAYLDRFSYRLFAHNVAVALAAARALGISDEVAYRGMLKAHPDPGALRITKIGYGATFVNGFAANEPSSTLAIWESIQDINLDFTRPIIVMNCRPDRIDRTRQFIDGFLGCIPNATLLIIGEGTGECQRAWDDGAFERAEEFACFEGTDVPKIMEWLEPRMENRIVFGVGNIHGIGNEFIDALMATRESEEE